VRRDVRDPQPIDLIPLGLLASLSEQAQASETLLGRGQRIMLLTDHAVD
jgi:hypothetical protein